MILFSSALTEHILAFKKLADCMEHLQLLATWTEDEWGYIRNKGIEARKDIMAALKDNIHIAFYGDLPVGMFGLFPHDTHSNISELMYVYLDKNARGLGFANQIIVKSKKIAKEQGHSLILLDTLKPKLNRLYEKHDAKVVCESTLFSHPTDVLSLSLS